MPLVVATGKFMNEHRPRKASERTAVTVHRPLPAGWSRAFLVDTQPIGTRSQMVKLRE